MTRSRNPGHLALAIALLLMQMLYVGSYFALVKPVYMFVNQASSSRSVGRVATYPSAGHRWLKPFF